MTNNIAQTQRASWIFLVLREIYKCLFTLIFTRKIVWLHIDNIYSIRNECFTIHYYLFFYLLCLRLALPQQRMGASYLQIAPQVSRVSNSFCFWTVFFVGSPVADLSSGLGSKQDDTSSFISSFLLLHRPTQIFCVKSVFCLDIHDFLLPLWILTL